MQQWSAMMSRGEISTRHTSSFSGLPGNIHKKGTQTFKTRIARPLCVSFLWGPPTDRKHQWCKAERGYIHSFSSQKKWKKDRKTLEQWRILCSFFFGRTDALRQHSFQLCEREGIVHFLWHTEIEWNVYQLRVAHVWVRIWPCGLNGCTHSRTLNSQQCGNAYGGGGWRAAYGMHEGENKRWGG